MNYLKYIGIAVASAIILVCGVLVGKQSSPPPVGDFNGGVNYIQSVNNNLSITVGPANTTRVLATSTARVLAKLTNGSSTAIYCNLTDASSTSLTSGIAITTGSPFTIDGSDLYTGSIQCTATASTTLSVSAQQ